MGGGGLKPTHLAGIPLRVAGEIVRAGQRMDRFGWVPATAGNISMRFGEPGSGGRIAITRSGVHKGFLAASDVIEVDFGGRPLIPGIRPSAETLLHCQILGAFPEAGAVLHGHSVAGTVLSMIEPAEALYFEGYELFKAFAGQATHDARLALPLFPNDQDMARLAAVIAPHLAAMPLGYYIRGHGAYVWAATMDAALARLEALEFILECELYRRRLAPGRGSA
jgi:methylthioribulose-1-phosphate dehydratase